MYYAIKSLPENIHSEVSCISETNLDQFPISEIHCLSRESKFKAKWNRVAQRLRLPIKFSVLSKHIAQSKPDIVHSHFGQIGVIDSPAVNASNAHHVVTVYGADVSRLPKKKPSIIPKYQKLFQHVSAVLCEGNHMAETVRSLGCPSEKVIVQHLGVDLKKFEFKPRQWTPDRPLKILVAATFTEKKGIPYALEAIGRIAKKQAVEITIIGDATNSQGSRHEKSVILQIVNDHQLDSLITWAGYQTHEKMLEIAYKNDLFVSTSVVASDGDNEGGAPVAIIEMAATGMPVISSWHCDIPEIILDKKTGWLAEERNVDSIVHCLNSAINEHASWNQICKAGRDHLESNYDLERQGVKLGEIYERIVSAKTNAR